MIEQSYGQPVRKIPPTCTSFSSDNTKKIHDVGVNFLTDTPVDSLITRVESGLDFILGHLSGPAFPRSISVPTIGGAQKEVSYKDLAISYYEGALWKDCRISAFYPGQKNPDIVFIDIDAKDFCSERAFKTALTRTLKNIKSKIGGHPTVLWSGRGYHVIQPINCNVDLNNVKEFADLVRDKEDVNKGFLQFAAKYLSNDKKDSCNHTSLKSCLLRVPYTHNSKCKAEEGQDPEVKILQEWDNFRPDVKLLLGSFYSHLVAEKIEEDHRREKYEYTSNQSFNSQSGQVTYWIEKLLDTPIDDYRKRARDLIIVPYLVVRRGMTDINEIEAIVMRWADRCGQLYPLEPSRREYAREIRSRVKEVRRGMVPSMRFDTLKEENPTLAKRLSG